VSISIRHARDTDIDWVVGELRIFADFFNTRHSLFGDETYIKETMTGISHNHLLLIAANEDDEPLGFIAGVVNQHFFNPKIKVLSELFWWVAQQYRNSRAGLMLLEAFTDWGKQNVDWITFALEHKSPVKDSSLLKRGFRPQERAFLMEVS